MMYPFVPWAWPIPGVQQPGTPPPQPSQGEPQVTGPGDHDLAGYTVQATDGEIGSIDEASYDVGSARLVVR